MMIDLIAISIALVAVFVSVVAYRESRRYQRTVTDAQLAVKCQPGSADDLEVLVVNIGAGIAYDVTFKSSSVADADRDMPTWNLDLGDLLPDEQRVVMRVDIDELATRSPMMVGIMYEKAMQYSYPTTRPKRPRLPDYQRIIEFGQWAYELQRQKGRRPHDGS